MRARAHARAWACVRLRACFRFEVCGATEPPAINNHALRCTRRTDLATESTRARCARRYRGVLHAAWWAARPLLQRTSDLHEARARAAAERGRALRGARCCGGRRLWHAGSQPPWRSLSDRVLPGSCQWRSDPPIASKRRPGPWCSTPPEKWQGPPAGLGAAGSGEPRAAGRARALPVPGRALECALPVGAIKRHGRARLGQPGRCDPAGQVQPAATLPRRWRRISDH